MIPPPEPELLGVSPGGLKLGGAGAHTAVRLLPGAMPSSSSLSPPRPGFAAAGGAPARAEQAAASERVYLHLENIRGTQDATVLSVYLNLPEGARPGDHDALLAGSIGLYGLRQASVPRGGAEGPGLSTVMNITALLAHLPATSGRDAREIRVSLVPDHPLSEPAEITVGRVAVFRQRY